MVVYWQMVWVEGFEPPAIRSQSGDSTRLSYTQMKFVGWFLRSLRRHTLKVESCVPLPLSGGVSPYFVSGERRLGNHPCAKSPYL